MLGRSYVLSLTWTILVTCRVEKEERIHRAQISVMGWAGGTLTCLLRSLQVRWGWPLRDAEIGPMWVSVGTVDRKEGAHVRRARALPSC